MDRSSLQIRPFPHRFRSHDVGRALLVPAAVISALLAHEAFAEPALRAEGGVTVVYQQEWDTGIDDSSVSADFFGYLETERGEWMIYVEAASATAEDSLFNRVPELNADAGSAQDVDGGARIQISEFNYRWDMTARDQLTVGSIDPSAHLDRSRIANDENTDFLGASFVNNPTIQFPDYSLGVMYRRTPDGRVPEVTAIVTSSDGLADNPGRSYRELVDVRDDGKGIFAGLGSRWYLGDTRVGVGAWYRSDHHPTLDDPDDTGHNYGAYAVYGRQVGAHSVTLRTGLARASVSAAYAYLGAAYELATPVGLLGAGLGQIILSHRDDGANRGDTTQAEVFFRMSLGRENVQLTPALQYVKNPGFDHPPAGLAAELLVAAIRFHCFL